MRTTTELIAREGWKPLIIVLFGFLFAVLLNWNFLAFVLLVFALCIAYFYRNLERVPEDVADDCVLAPLDGVIKNIQNKEDGIYLNIKKPICFCGMLRMPLARFGKVGEAVELERICGLKNGKSANGERVKIAFKRDRNSEAILYLTLYPRNFSQLVLYFWDLDFKLGERLGFFLVGNAVLKMPLESELKVNIGDSIYAGQTLLASLKG
ncbi:hypothetical protein [Helicobacter turcicus]|uniref:Phosphatidylserine decarboxylase n=1 Tax=Helicobacter turcicus TaxID=2867412 RepID=A0ABS7JMC5_9HELI|nr:hypothetical protein [Helicobacter turcicus]MBX7490548.1 hypothetical protein [Helicobacter turcicus]MBX7545542.1 hypothetical protein [Helicobacter turcicus]